MRFFIRFLLSKNYHHKIRFFSVLGFFLIEQKFYNKSRKKKKKIGVLFGVEVGEVFAQMFYVKNRKKLTAVAGWIGTTLGKFQNSFKIGVKNLLTNRKLWCIIELETLRNKNRGQAVKRTLQDR